jgi:curved DNA-binding protein CbpA
VTAKRPELAPFEVLGLHPSASQEEIVTAFKILAQIYHPDRFRDSPEAVRAEAEYRMRALNAAYNAAKKGRLLTNESGSTNARHSRPTAAWDAGSSKGARNWDGVAWTDANKARAAAMVKDNEAKAKSKQQAKRNGQAVVRPRSVEPSRNSFLTGLGLARVTNNVVCIGCDSVQWLPPGWRDMLDDSAFFCGICDRIILARGLR